MDSLRSDEIVTADDLEAQHRSQWLSKLKNTLRDGEEKEENKWDFCILKVPEHYRQPPEEYTPAAWRFGLHNRENLDTNGSEALKISYAGAFGLVGDALDNFCDAVVDDPKSMLPCYGLQEEGTSWSDEVIKYVLALDALFLALEFDGYTPQLHLWNAERLASIAKDTVYKARYNSWVISGLLELDICKYENQIPFEIVQKAYTYLRTSTLQSTDEDQVPSDGNEAESYRRWEKKWMASVLKAGINNFMDLDFDSVQDEYLFPLTNSKPILGLAYEAICGREGMRRSEISQNDYIRIPSATQLIASGINVKGLLHVPLCAMSYGSKCLSLPRMKIYDATIPFIRNMAKHEEQLKRCLFHDYVLIMIDLIKTPMDLEILIKCGVIENGNGTRTFNNWMAVEQCLLVMPSSREHNLMKVAINKRCEYRRYRHWSEFKIRFCSRPWLVLSALTIVLVTVATLLQTYAAIIGSNRMKPQFP